MNKIIKQLSNRRSVRDFTGESVKKEDLDLILKTAQRCPTSINGQQISLIYTQDKALIKEIAKLCGGQPQVESANVFVTFVIDFARTDYALTSVGKKQVVQNSAEGIVVGSIDAGIMLSSLQTAAESLGYGTTAIGAVRIFPDEFIKLLNLPKDTYPVVGSTIGVPTKEALRAPIKPRVPFESFAFEGKYNSELVKKGVDTYERELTEFRKANNMDYKTSYIDLTASFYERFYMPEVKKSFEKQGFKFEDE